MSFRQRRYSGRDIGLAENGNGRAWPTDEVLVVALTRPDAKYYVLTLPQAALRGEGLTSFLDRVAPFGCPVPGSLIRAYSLPDAPFPSILLKEHEDAPDGVGDAYRRFLAVTRRHWIGALDESGPGLSPAFGWAARGTRQLLSPEELAAVAAEAGLVTPGVVDGYLGRGLLLLAHPDLAESWPTMMSLGGPTKIRKITGREFPVWVDLPAHQASLAQSPLLERIEELLEGAAA